MDSICETVLQGKIERMRHATESVRFIVIHCSATRCNRPYTAQQLEHDHRSRGFRTTGYHFYIRTDGTTTHPRLLGEVGAHVKGLNHCSIGICYEGGLDRNGKAKDTRTDAQKRAMRELVADICKRYEIVDVLGHRDTSPDKDGNGIVERWEWLKECPCFEVKDEFVNFLRPVIVKPER